EPIATLPTYVDRVAVAADPVPLPAAPRALFVGALERCKGVDTLLDAWPIVAARLPDARLWIVGRGARAESMAARWSREGATRVQWTPSLANGEVARALDESTVLVVPSAMEGMGRVVVEAFARGRPVIGTRGGGIADLVQDGRNGLLVDPGDPAQLADALVRVLEDGALASRLGAGALESTDGWLFGADEWAVRFRDLVCRAALPAPAAGYNRWPRPT
ncbi:MAG TPA: glycosyltransferase family 4 protein, partial [Gaiellaceae bacterium]|nr:glycosyltransferase family 4 protein [Gaiellaceae bacterium]